jgi:hypothetical protein
MNNHDAPPLSTDEPAAHELPAIEFESPGRFAIHNPAQQNSPPSEIQAAAPWASTPNCKPSAPGARRSHPWRCCNRPAASFACTAPTWAWLYHHSSIQEACTRFLLANPKNQLRILLRDSSRAVKDGHRLLTLARRLPSSCQIRKLHPDYPNEEITFLLADHCGLLLRPELSQFAGYALYQDPVRNRQRLSQFEQAWATSISDADLRSFLL